MIQNNWATPLLRWSGTELGGAERGEEAWQELPGLSGAGGMLGWLGVMGKDSCGGEGGAGGGRAGRTGGQTWAWAWRVGRMGLARVGTAQGEVAPQG